MCTRKDRNEDLVRQKKYHASHLEEARIYEKQYRIDHREELRIKAHEKYLAHRDENRARSTEYHRLHKGELDAKQKAYNQTAGGKQAKRRVMQKRRNEQRGGGLLDIKAFYVKCTEVGWHCRICGKKLTKETVTIDHVVPVCRGGTNSIENLQPLCKHCNCKKEARPMREMLGSQFLFN